MRKILIVVAMFAVAACQDPVGSSADIELYEFDIDPSISRFEAGQVDLDVRNTGEFGHTLVITDSTGQVISAGDVIGPGATSQVSVELAAGEYSFTCRIVAQDDEGNVIDHFEQGMTTDVVVVTG